MDDETVCTHVVWTAPLLQEQSPRSRSPQEKVLLGRVGVMEHPPCQRQCYNCGKKWVFGSVGSVAEGRRAHKECAHLSTTLQKRRNIIFIQTANISNSTF